jgi:hypothetical protein
VDKKLDMPDVAELNALCFINDAETKTSGMVTAMLLGE